MPDDIPIVLSVLVEAICVKCVGMGLKAEPFGAVHSAHTRSPTIWSMYMHIEASCGRPIVTVTISFDGDSVDIKHDTTMAMHNGQYELVPPFSAYYDISDPNSVDQIEVIAIEWANKFGALGANIDAINDKYKVELSDLVPRDSKTTTSSIVGGLINW